MDNALAQRERAEAGGIDIAYLQRQYELSNSPVTHFTADELKTIYTQTDSSYKTMTLDPNGTNVDFLTRQTLSGIPQALYDLANVDGGSARITYNGEKKKLLLERTILLLIAYTKGKYEPAREALDFAARTLSRRIKYDNLNSFDSVMQAAEVLHEKL